ncbi:hypothetical protein D3Z60_24280 [Lachnospiraceae bacterium]|nr:hypothetical protein [Lachnospiraceae bacterium]
MDEYRMNDVDLPVFLHSFRDGDGKLPSDFEHMQSGEHYLIHWDSERAFCLKEREIYLKDTMENLLAKSICFFSDMPVSFAVHVKESGRADIEVLDSRKLSMEIKVKQVKGKSITVKYKDGTTDKGSLKTEKYIKGPFGETVNTIHYACVADTLLSLRREVYSASYEAENERSLSAAVREIHRKRERTFPVKPPGALQEEMKDMGLLLAIRQTRYLHGLPDEKRIAGLKEQMKEEDYIKVSPELAAQAKKFGLPRYALQKSGEINYIHDISSRDKKGLFLMKRDWLKMLDILINEKPVQCSRELLVAMKMETKSEASSAKTERDVAVFSSINVKLSCFLEAVDRHNLSHILEGQTKDWMLPRFISAEEKQKLSGLYRFPEREAISVAERSFHYPEAMRR